MKCGSSVLALALMAPAAGADVPLMASQVPGLEITPLTDLPAAPAGVGDDGYCAHFFLDEVKTPAAKAVLAKGWKVTGEQPFGPYTAVSFVGKTEPATSGACALSEGNVALWKDGHMAALVYGLRHDDDLIGRVVPFGANGLRILSGDIVPGTVADLRLVGQDGLAVTPPAMAEPVCDGRAMVPFVEAMPINMARILLAESGWQPVPNPEPGMGMPQALAAVGVTEVEDCAGTGFGFCSYGYSNPAGSLSVVTVGEGDDAGLPRVTGYGVACAIP